MDNPFANDSRLTKMSKAGANFAVIFPNGIDTHEFMRFKERIKAWHEAEDVAGSGLYVYILDIYNGRNTVIAYLSGFCNRR